MPRRAKSPTPNEYEAIDYPPPSDPRAVPDCNPIARPQEGERYPQQGIPYPDPDRDPLADPTLTSLVPATAVVGAPDFTIQVLGTNFTPGTVILWNGTPEATTVVSATELTTGVNMTTVSGPATVPVAVRAPTGVETASLPFTFTAA